MFKLLGVPFDTELTMANAVSELVSSAGWKLRTLLRIRRFDTDADLIIFYKAHLLSYLEYRRRFTTRRVRNSADWMLSKVVFYAM